MIFFATVLLLAAISTSSIAGPVPKNNKRQLFTSYANSTSTAFSTQGDVSQSQSVIELSSVATSSIEKSMKTPSPSLPTSSSTRPNLSSASGQTVKADTAVVIEPIQHTVFTSIISAITFMNPKGEPIATQDATTILSTLFITPTPTPAPASTSPTIKTSSSSRIASQISFQASSQPVVQSESGQFAASSSTVLAGPSSSQTAIRSGPRNITSIPSFSYSPEESESGVPIASSSPAASSTLAASTTSSLISTATIGNSTGLPGFNHPGQSPQNTGPSTISPASTIASSSFVATSPAQSASPPIPTTSIASILSSAGVASSTLGSLASSSTPGYSTRIVITKTQYTTVYPSTPAAIISSALATSIVPPEAPISSQRGSELGGISTSTQVQQSIAFSSDSAAESLPPTPLQPPPVVIVTQYTTVAPSPPTIPSQAPNPVIPTSAPVPSISSASAVSPSSIAAAPSPVLPPNPPPVQPEPSSQAPEQPSQSSSPGPPPAVSTTQAALPPPPPAPTPGTPVPPATPTTTSEGPLIITPIGPSQIFTITVTETLKETVTETATVSVTVKA